VLFFSRLSISDKLKYMIFLVCAVALTGVSIGYMLTEFFLHRLTFKEHAQTVTDILNTTVSAAIIFDAPSTVGDLKTALAGEPYILAAVLYDRNGEIFTTYFRAPSDKQLPVWSQWVAQAIADGGTRHRFTLTRLEYTVPVSYEGDPIGQLYIHCDLSVMYAKFRRNVVAMSFMLLLSMFGAYILAGRLQRRISGPIFLLQDAIESAQVAIKRAESASRAKSEAIDELKRTQAQLVRTAKLASIGELAAGVAHELNQPLMVIRGTVQIMNRSLPLGRMTEAQLADGLKNIDKNSSRMMNIIDPLRTFSHQSTMPFAQTDVNEVIRECFLMIGGQLRLRSISIGMELDQTLPTIHGSGQQLEQVILNLITNARDAILDRAATEKEPEGFEGRITIRTAAVAGGVEVIFQDNGRGIPESAKQKIFDPFFTTKEVGKGTGLGLSISFGIIEAHTGRIEIVQTSEKGTAFKIFLPAFRCHSPTGNDCCRIEN
jgi:signal transduction histidine kinase